MDNAKELENVNNNINIDENIKENNNDDNNDNFQMVKTMRVTGRETLADEEENDNRTCCQKCCFCLCCCCLCCINKEKSKNSYRRGWKDYLIREGNDESNKPFKLLTNLFVNEEDAISGLESIRLNPNLVSENKLRNDLEFYIPQLCTFLLFGEVKDIEEFFVFLCKVCNASFFFAHRVHWFLSAMINAAEDKREDIIRILKMINTLFKSENAVKKTKIGKFYVSNAEKFIDYIKKNNLYYLYDVKKIQKGIDCLNEIDYNDLNGYQQELYNKYKDNRDIIAKYSENEYLIAKAKEEKRIEEKLKKAKNKNEINITRKNDIISRNDSQIQTNEIKKKFKANDFFIDISNFELENIDYTYEADSDDEDDARNYSIKETIIVKDSINEIENSDKRPKIPFDINFISYHSSLNFIEHLCDISNELPKHPINEQKLYLYEQLLEINKKLPCNVYLPFLKDSTRNYIICHIPLEEVRIFRTKTRCPIMLTFEIIRIDETIKENEEDIENLQNDGHSRSNTVSSIGLKYNKKKSKLPTVQSRIEYEYDIDNLHTNADFNLSKPLMLSINTLVKTKTLMKKDSKDSKGSKDGKNTNKEYEMSVLPSKEEYEEDMDNYVLNTKNSLDLRIKEKEEENKRLLDIASKFSIQPMKNNIRATVNEISDTNDYLEQPNFRLHPSKTVKQNSRTNSSSFDLANKLIKNKQEEINEISSNSNNESTDSGNQIYEEEDDTQPSGSINQDFFDKIFGETIEEKEKNLKNNSIFGKIETHKLFRCIFKTHEDLRQEQFATQLINEFYQIFKLENTGCWLNTYEIISTGNDSGLVEMVDNSLSLDQLKQKTKHISLKDFYINCYGKGDVDSLSYKTAMDNYVASLAGYSLVCYFLQIKDRHNGNILIDNQGHLVHIDFGFLLSNAPGKGLKFENAPFKLSNDMVDCLGGVNGKYFEEFRKLLKKGFLAVNKHRHKIIILVEMMWCGHGKKLDCFEKGQETIDELKMRLSPKDATTKKDILKFVDDLIGQSVDNWRTKWYDIFQYHVQGIFY